MGEDLALANGHVCNFWLCSCLPFDTAVIQGQPKASFRRCGTVFPRKWGRSCLSHPCACTASPPKGDLQGKQIKPLKPDGAVRKLCGGPPGKRRACYHILKMCHATLSTHASDRLGWGEDLSGFPDSGNHQQELRAESWVPQYQLKRTQQVPCFQIILVMFNKLLPWASLFVWQILIALSRALG